MLTTIVTIYLSIGTIVFAGSLIRADGHDWENSRGEGIGTRLSLELFPALAFGLGWIIYLVVWIGGEIIGRGIEFLGDHGLVP